MKRLFAMAATVVLMLGLTVTAPAASKATSEKAEVSQGLINAKKVMKSRIDRDKKIHALQKKAKEHRAAMQNTLKGQNAKEPTPPQ